MRLVFSLASKLASFLQQIYFRLTGELRPFRMLMEQWDEFERPVYLGLVATNASTAEIAEQLAKALDGRVVEVEKSAFTIESRRFGDHYGDRTDALQERRFYLKTIHGGLPAQAAQAAVIRLARKHQYYEPAAA